MRMGRHKGWCHEDVTSQGVVSHEGWCCHERALSSLMQR